MRKIPTLFLRGEDHLVTTEVNPEAQWVIDGEGIATRKWDGTACMVKDGQLFKWYTYKRGPGDVPPPPPNDFLPATEIDEQTNKQEGWLPIRSEGKEDRWHREAVFFVLSVREEIVFGPPEDGTYELVGPKINNNPDEFSEHVLLRHGTDMLQPQPPRLWPLLNSYFFALAMQGISIEGIVWHHEDGRMVKIKGKDFGIRRS